MAFLEAVRIRPEFVDEFFPGILRIDPLERFPVPLHLFVWAKRHELDRPDDDLAKVSDHDLTAHVDLRLRGYCIARSRRRTQRAPFQVLTIPRGVGTTIRSTRASDGAAAVFFDVSDWSLPAARSRTLAFRWRLRPKDRPQSPAPYARVRAGVEAAPAVTPR